MLEEPRGRQRGIRSPLRINSYVLNLSSCVTFCPPPESYPVKTKKTPNNERQGRMLQECRIDRQDINGDAALNRAVFRKNESMVRLLLTSGAEPSLANVELNTPLMLAASQGQEKIVKLLLQHDADVTRKNFNGNSALMLAVGNSHASCTKMLLDAGASPYRKNDKKENAFTLAANKPEIMLILKDHQDPSKILQIFRTSRR